MIELLTADEMGALDRWTIEQLGVPGMVLMENAADGCVRALRARWGQAPAGGVVVLAGPGNNGGDGYVIARKLANGGTPVRVLVLVDPAAIGGDAAANLALLPAFGVDVTPVLDDSAVDGVLAPALQGAGVVVDALFGTGLQRPLGGRFARAVAAIEASGRPVMAVDIPSGIDATSGAVLGAAARAELTVTFCRPKLGHVLYPGADLRGALEVVDIGIPEPRVAAADVRARLLGPDAVAPLAAPRPRRAHKGTYGHALLLAGSAAMPGAAVLAANAALTAGAGLVTLAVPAGVEALLRGLLPEVIVRTLPAADGAFAASAADGLGALLAGKTAAAIGPGVGRSEATVRFVRRAVRNVAMPAVVDADGLRALEGSGPVGGGADARVLTPHPGELAGLLGTDVAGIEVDRIAAARRAAAELGARVVLKGASTLIAEPDGQLWVNPTGNPGMASAGTGDVLTGLMVGLLAQRGGALADDREASCAAVYLHGLAGDLAAADRGEPALRAGDIIDRVGEAIAACTAPAAREAFRWR